MENYDLYSRAKDSAKDYLSGLPELSTLATWQDCEDYLDKLSDLQDESSDYAHTEADSWDWVIYMHHAWNLVNKYRGCELDQSEESMMDCGFEFESLDQAMTQAAYWLVYQAIYDAIQEQCETLREFVTYMQGGMQE